MKLLKIFILTVFILSPVFSKNKNIETVLKIKPPIKYNLNLKYDPIKSYKKSMAEDEKDKDTDWGLDFEFNKELMTLDKLKIDVGTTFQGLN